jgi:Fungal fucose-specific lectin
VYAINEKNELIETAYSNAWVGTKSLTTTVTDSGVAAITWEQQNTTQIRVYFQAPTGIQEWTYDGNKWIKGSNVPLYQ